MYKTDDTVVYKGHGLVRVSGIRRKKLESGEDTFYILKSLRAILSHTRMLVAFENADEVLRYPMKKKEAREIIAILGEPAEELPGDPRDRMELIDEVMERNDIRELAALVRDYRETKMLNIERMEMKKVKGISRNIAEELCNVLNITRASLRGKLFVRIR